jgi:ElaB/YqjD/DUF883 family membrane-anchored ribosome-binding protein
METTATDLATKAKDIGHDAAESARETAQNLANRARRFGSEAMVKARATYGVARSKAVAGAAKTDQTIRANPYTSLGVAFGVGIILGFLVRRRR